MEFVENKDEKSYKGLDYINLGEIDSIIKQNIYTIYKDIVNTDESLKTFFSRVTTEIEKKIRNAETAYKVMSKIKEICDKQKTRDTSYYLHKLETREQKILTMHLT